MCAQHALQKTYTLSTIESANSKRKKHRVSSKPRIKEEFIDPYLRDDKRTIDPSLEEGKRTIDPSLGLETQKRTSDSNVKKEKRTSDANVEKDKRAPKQPKTTPRQPGRPKRGNRYAHHAGQGVFRLNPPPQPLEGQTMFRMILPATNHPPAHAQLAQEVAQGTAPSTPAVNPAPPQLDQTITYETGPSTPALPSAFAAGMYDPYDPYSAPSPRSRSTPTTRYAHSTSSPALSTTMPMPMLAPPVMPVPAITLLEQQRAMVAQFQALLIREELPDVHLQELDLLLDSIKGIASMLLSDIRQASFDGDDGFNA